MRRKEEIDRARARTGSHIVLIAAD